MTTEQLNELAENIRTQDNRATAWPAYVVQEQRKVYGVSSDYTEHFEKLDKAHGGGVIGYHLIWEDVQWCFTEKGAQDYIIINGHNLHSPRIYVKSLYRNLEMQAVREFILSQAKQEAKE